MYVESAISIALHILIILLAEGLVFYLYIEKTVHDSVYNNITIINDKFKNSIKMLFYYIYAILYKNNRIYDITYQENQIYNDNNKKNIIIFIVLCISLLIILISIILVSKYKYRISINYKLILITVIISILLIGFYEGFLFILTILKYTPNEYEFIYKLLNYFYGKYNSPNTNYKINNNTLLILNAINKFVLNPS